MNILILIFLTFSHFNHEKIACETCHNMENPQKILKTDKKLCVECHKDNPKKHYFTLKDSNGIKFTHAPHQFLSCSNCHTIIKDKIIKPKMENCSSCHDSQKDSSKPNCVQCHTYNKRFVTHYKKKTFTPLNHNNINYKVKHIVSNENYCMQCHKKSYCKDCHDSSSKFNSAEKFHTIDYLSIHKYEKNLNTCKSCHKNNKDCKACHQKSGIDTTDLTKQNRNYTIHAKNWNHGKAAYKNINSCVSCHSQNDCISCHKKDENPHKRNKKICKNAVKQKRSCERCHEKVKDICP